ncbi:MAG: M28 family peptidase [Asgard group archaeon]|nr:M28 family peptidase [Asgard group archaeon]
MCSILQKVEIERLYQHVLKIEGVKHHIVDLRKLNETADYILSEFQKYGLQINEHSFEIEGSDIIFRNIEGWLGDETKPEILVTSHYDTVRNAPGADDNGSAVAAMLEIARVLAAEDYTGSIRFVSFTLEELNPTLSQKHREKGIELGIFDGNYKYKSYHSQKMLKKFYSKVRLRISKGKPILESYEKAFDDIKEELTDLEKEFCKYVIDLRSNMTRTSWIGQSGVIGSNNWVNKAIEEKKKIKGVINLESVGYTSKRKNSQILPPFMNPLTLPSYKVKAFKKIGNFISVVSDKNSKNLGKVFCKSCKNEEIKLPYLWGKLPLRFEKIAKWIHDTLRADHAPFWKENIPALMITDTANFRNPYYHTEADTIDKLDFDFMKKVTQATIATVLDFSEERDK